jgi:hypothetical protein
MSQYNSITRLFAAFQWSPCFSVQVREKDNGPEISTLRVFLHCSCWLNYVMAVFQLHWLCVISYEVRRNALRRISKQLFLQHDMWMKLKTELCALSPRANYIDRHLSATLVPTFADKGCQMASVTDLYGRILGFPNRNRYFFFQLAPQLYSRGSVDPVPDPLLVRKCGRAGNRTRTSGSVARNSDR